MKKIILSVLLIFTIGIAVDVAVVAEKWQSIFDRKYYSSYGKFYTLTEAYDNGFLTKDDIMHISYYYSGKVVEIISESGEWENDYWRGEGESIRTVDFTPETETPPAIDTQTDKEIRESYMSDYHDYYKRLYKDFDKDYGLDDLSLDNYGAYDERYAVVVLCDFYFPVPHPAVGSPPLYNIGGIIIVGDSINLYDGVTFTE